MAESVQLATIYLVDLVGSTRLATSVGPARADELMREYFGLLREAIETCGGTEFKDTGDGLFAAFSSASAGVRCAVLTQQLFERRYRGAEQQLHVRIGLGTGESTLRDDGWFGMPSIEAARLCDEAPADGILISPGTRLMAGRVEGAGFESVGELELKGIPEPMEAFSVVWEPLDPERPTEVGRWPLPDALRAVPRIAYVGREVERGLVEHARNEARSGARRLVLLSGEPGIGKTRLAAYSALGANADGFAVCWGACSEDLAAPYEPWIDVCSQLVEHASEAVLAGYVGRFGGEIGRLSRNLSHRVPDAPGPQSSDPETERFLLFKGVAELLRTVAGSVPLCVVLDDFHCADAQSVALLKHVSRVVEKGSLIVVVAYRDTDLGKDDPLTAVLADLRRLDGVERIALQGLAVEDVATMTAAAAGHDLDADGLALAGEIASETDGNPFFVGEILRNLSESGMVVFDEERGRWRIDRSSGVALPESVREVVERRVAVLGGRARELLTAAAVIGRSFELDLLVAVAELDEKRVLDDLESAVAASVLEESIERLGEFRFAHALINQTLYEDLGATRRARLHRRIAETLEAQLGDDPGPRVDELAHHWARATTAVDVDKAIVYARMAGERALAGLAPGEAVGWFDRALELLGDRDEPAICCDLRIGLGEAQRLTGAAEYRQTLLDAGRIASELGDGERSARAALANNRGFYSALGQVDHERLAAIERALELDEPSHPARRARLLALQALELTYDPNLERRRTLVEEAIATARGAGDRRALAEALRSAFFALWSAKTLGLQSALAEELAGLADELADPGLRRATLNIELHVSVQRGEFARAQAALERMQEIAAELGRPQVNWAVAFQTAGLKLLRGELAAGERLVERALQLGQEAEQPDAVLFYGAQMLYLRTYQGRGEEIIAMFEQSVQANPAVPALRAGLASSLCWLDRRAEAAVILKRAAGDRFEHVLPASDELTALHLYADAAAQTCDRPVAAILYERIQPSADQLDWQGLSGYGHDRLYLGLLAATLGEHEQASEHLAFACEFHETNDMPLWTARGHLGWAEALVARGDADGAREHATRALELSQQHGYGAFEPRAATLLAAQAAAQA